MRSLIKFLLIFLFIAGYSLSGLAQHVNLSNFHLVPANREVLILWTIDSGPTCNGITVLHSKDSLDFTEIGNIGGVCGSSSFATSYEFTDHDPVLNGANYYKIRLGYSQFSEVQVITLNYIQPGKILIKPNPVSGSALIEFENEKGNRFQLIVTDIAGEAVLIRQNIAGNSIAFEISGWLPGTYFVTLTDPGGNVLSDKLIITN